ncbi:MAG: C10 family peptidase [Muribaculaceae bacterium]|nr:C10 family peptidase [Muribaculaceae bacterium]
MKKFSLGLLTMALLTASGLRAAPLSPEAALDRVEGPLTRGSVNPKLVKTLHTPTGTPALYLFNKGEADGFMVVTADDAFTPLLGYADAGSLDPENIAPGLAYWLDEYTRQIDFALDRGVAPISTRAGITLPDWQPISPLLKTLWNQDEPYNNLCPEDPYYNYKRSYTGCLATSMAQVMNYFQYPLRGQGSNSYLAYEIDRRMSMVFSEVEFDWENMLPSYSGDYTEEQAKAVATLMLACGISVNMNYTAAVSGAINNAVAPALVTYFKYDKGIEYYTRDYYTYTEWAEMLYNNLKNVGPVIYNGNGSGGGHSFVFDGYDGQGYFHINWGWGGLSNGYYLVDALQPGGIGIGGGMGAYNFNQGGIFNVKPAGDVEAEEQHEMVMFGSLTGIVNDDSLILNLIDAIVPGWGILSTKNMNVQLGVGYLPADQPDATPQYIADRNNDFTNVSPSTYIGNKSVSINLPSMNLQEGVKYKVFSAYRQKNSDWLEVMAENGMYNYFYLTKEGGSYIVDNIPPMAFEADKIELLTDLYEGSAVKVQVTLSNPNPIELSKSVALALVGNSGRLQFLGENVLFTLAPEETRVVEWATPLWKLSYVGSLTSPTEYYPGLYNEKSDEVFYTSPSKVVMNPASEDLDLAIDITIPGVSQDAEGSYIVEDASNFNVMTQVTVNSGYLADMLYLSIYQPVEGSDRATGLQAYPLGEFTVLNNGESLSWNTTVDFSAAELDGFYYLGVTDSNMRSLAEQLTVSFVVKGVGGVETIKADPSDGVYYNLQGIPVSNPRKGVIYIHNGKKIMLR